MVTPSLDGRVVTSEAVEYAYRERDGMVWARWHGGDVRQGRLVGTRAGDDLDLRAVVLRWDGTTAGGRCRSRVSTLEDGRLALDETWVWEPGGEETGVVVEARPLVHPSGVSLRPIVGEDGHRAVMRLTVAPGQVGFVASNPVSLAQGQWEEPPGWMRGIWHDDRLVGFVMLEDDRHDEGLWFLWRFMIAADDQRSGYGRAALELVCEHLRRSPPPRELGVSWVEEPGGPGPFYRAFGFVETGEIDDDEVVARLIRWPDPLP